MQEGFWGAIIIDDPLKPEDAFSEAKLKAANRRLLTTIKSRKANPATPIVVIMQRSTIREVEVDLVTRARKVKVVSEADVKAKCEKIKGDC